jgi:hypothetical protein
MIAVYQPASTATTRKKINFITTALDSDDYLHFVLLCTIFTFNHKFHYTHSNNNVDNMANKKKKTIVPLMI